MIDFIKNFRYNKYVNDKEKKLEKIATEIATLEKMCQSDPANKSQYMDKMNELTTQNFFSSLPEESATSTRLIVTTPWLNLP